MAFSDFDMDSIFEGLNITYNGSVFWVDPVTQPCSPAPVPEAALTAVSVFYTLVFVLAVPGNLLVGLVMCLNKRPLSSSDLYLLHLAVADVLLAATLPFWATAVTRGWVFGDAMCKAVSVLQELSFFSSILFLACISVDRYLAVARVRPTADSASAAHKVSGRRLGSWCACAAVWLAGALLSLPGLMNSAGASNGTLPSACAERYAPGSGQRWRLATRGLSLALGFVAPLAVMLLCYGATVRRLLRTKDGFRRQRALRVIAAVVAAFLACWTPYHVAVVTDAVLRAGPAAAYRCPARAAVDRALFATQSLGLLHSCVNPALYAFVGRKFRGRLETVVKRTSNTNTPRASKSSSVDRTSTIL